MEEDKDSPCCGKEGGWIIQSTDLGSYCSKCKEPVDKVYAPVKIESKVESHGLSRKEKMSANAYQPGQD
ncbi:MAG: hypothetical protein ACHQUC_08405 [Chlamydiales bacterium]